MSFEFCGLKIDNKLFLAPMADFTDVPFRLLCLKHGAGLTYPEMIHVNRFRENFFETTDVEKFFEDNKNFDNKTVQFVGSELKAFENALEGFEKQVDLIDLNFGCPSPKIVDSDCGAAYLKNLDDMKELVETLISISSKPVTVKTRLGFDTNICVEVAKIVERAGASAITVHGRTVKQKYSGLADWNAIKNVKSSVGIPVVGNGDIISYDLALEKLDVVDFVMIGRGALGNPQVFEKSDLSVLDRFESLEEYLVLCDEFDLDFTSRKLQVLQFVKGLKGAANYRDSLSRSKSKLELVEKVREIIDKEK